MNTNDATSLEPIVAGILDLSAGRFGATTAAAIGMTGIIISWRALARSGGRIRPGTDPGAGAGDRLARTTLAMVLGLVGMVVGGLIVAIADGGLGTGNGLGGAIVAMVLGVVAVALGGLARARTRGVA